MSINTDDDDLFGSERLQGQGEDFLIVGLGASAGGIHALQQFFAHIPADSGMAYVVILHLSPDHESRLAEVLQTTATIPVTQVRNRVRVEPNHVYVISPNQSLAMSDGFLALSEIKGVEERRAPVDIFFRTLAESHHSRAVSVVLSGTGANGSMGLKRVKEMGGIALVQSPSEAEYSDMPRNAIATGLVDYVLPVSQIPAKIIGYRERLGQVKIPVGQRDRDQRDEIALRDIFTQLRVKTGHDFANYKRSTVLRRIERRITVHELEDLPAYARFLREQDNEPHALLKDLLISVTNFFRDAESFEVIEKKVIPSLFEGKGREDHVRVWVAGCATGEEAYSIAMLLAEQAEGSLEAPAIHLFATDIDEWAIAKAREGYYTLNDAADVSPERLRQFFVKEGEGYRIRRELREMVLFANHNLIKDPPFSHLDLVSCRNLLIYLNRPAQQRVMEMLHFAMNPGAYLFLGTSESIEGSNDLFVIFDKDHHIYQSRPVETRLPLPVPHMSLTLPHLRVYPTIEHNQIQPTERLSYLDLHQRLLEEYAPPSVLIDEEYDVLHFSERAGRYMQIAGGEPSHNLLKIIRPDLRLDLRTALYQAVQNRTFVQTQPLPVVIDNETEYVDMLIRPVLRAGDITRGFILVLFEPSDGAPKEAVTTIAAAEPMARNLEEELMRVKSQLTSTIEQSELQTEELKASNEELQAMNEELRSAAEELETSKEELQSLNEELTTVNQELKIKIEEITQTTNNVRNLINSTDIGTVFLDRSLRVRLFSPRSRDIFNLIPADLGRSIHDITSRLEEGMLAADVTSVLDSLHIIEREIKTNDSKWYLMRILPYRTADDRIEGVVVTFLDITQRRNAEEAMHASEEQLQSIVNGITEYAIIRTDTNGVIETWNSGAEIMFGYTKADATGQPVTIIFTPEDKGAGAAQDEMRRAREDRRAMDERWHMRKDGTRLFVSGVLTAIGKPVTGYIKIARDLTKTKQAGDDLQLAHERLEETVIERTRELANANETLRTEIAERIQSEKARVRLLRRIVVAQEDERRRIARDIHDQLGQQTTALRLKLEAIKALARGNDKLREAVRQTNSAAEQLDASVDFLAWELRPAGLEDLGIRVALGNYLKEWASFSGVLADYHTRGLEEDRLLPEVEMNLYRIAQEALNNVAKHAQASRVDVLLEKRDHTVVLIVEDDGIGFDPEKQTAGEQGSFGLLGMRERAALVGGTVEVESHPGEGTTVFVRTPLELATDWMGIEEEN